MAIRRQNKPRGGCIINPLPPIPETVMRFIPNSYETSPMGIVRTTERHGRTIQTFYERNLTTGKYEEVPPMGFPPPPTKGTPMLEMGSTEPVGWLANDGRWTPNARYKPSTLTVDEKFDLWVASDTELTFSEWAYPTKPEGPPNLLIGGGIRYNADGTRKRGWIWRLFHARVTPGYAPTYIGPPR